MKTHYKPLSRFFPKGHIREGEPTCFVEKLVKSGHKITFETLNNLGYKNLITFMNFMETVQPKYHTIRSGNKVKVGDKIQFFVWSNKPYRSKWIKIAEPIEVKKVWDFELIDGFITIGDSNYVNLNNVAKNDGLSYEDFKAWFGNFEKPFEGQIICWGENINY